MRDRYEAYENVASMGVSPLGRGALWAAVRRLFLTLAVVLTVGSPLNILHITHT